MLSSFPRSQSFPSWDFRLEWCKCRKARLTVPCVTHCLQNARFVTTLSFLIHVYILQIPPSAVWKTRIIHNYTLSFQFWTIHVTSHIFNTTMYIAQALFGFSLQVSIFVTEIKSCLSEKFSPHKSLKESSSSCLNSRMSAPSLHLIHKFQAANSDPKMLNCSWIELCDVCCQPNIFLPFFLG